MVSLGRLTICGRGASSNCNALRAEQGAGWAVYARSQAHRRTCGIQDQTRRRLGVRCETPH